MCKKKAWINEINLTSSYESSSIIGLWAHYAALAIKIRKRIIIYEANILFAMGMSINNWNKEWLIYAFVTTTWNSFSKGGAAKKCQGVLKNDGNLTELEIDVDSWIYLEIAHWIINKKLKCSKKKT